MYSGPAAARSVPRADVRVALAAAVARPDTSIVTVLNADGLSVDRLPISVAVRTGVCFYVMARPGMLCADFDRADDAPRARRLCGYLEDLRLLPVLVASGQPGHRHVVCKVPEQLWKPTGAVARRLGADVRGSIRPPLTPHRHGLAVELLSPVDPTEATWWLRARSSGAYRGY